MEDLPDELLVAVLSLAPASDLGRGCWSACRRWNRVLRDTSLFGWTCAECSSRLTVAHRQHEAEWFRKHALDSDGVHICFRCAFCAPPDRSNPILTNPNLVDVRIVDWRCYDLRDVHYSPKGMSMHTVGANPKAFAIRLPLLLYHGFAWCEPDSTNVCEMLARNRLPLAFVGELPLMSCARNLLWARLPLYLVITEREGRYRIAEFSLGPP